MTNIEIINLAIAVLGVVLAIISFIYTWHFNRYGIELTGCYQEEKDGHVKIRFALTNVASRALYITNIQMFIDQEEIFDNGFDPVSDAARKQKKINIQASKDLQAYGANVSDSFFNDQETISSYSPELIKAKSHNFENAMLLTSNQRISFSYYVDTVPNKIKVSSNHAIAFIFRKRLFDVEFDHDD